MDTKDDDKTPSGGEVLGNIPVSWYLDKARASGCSVYVGGSCS